MHDNLPESHANMHEHLWVLRLNEWQFVSVSARFSCQMPDKMRALFLVSITCGESIKSTLCLDRFFNHNFSFFSCKPQFYVIHSDALLSIDLTQVSLSDFITDLQVLCDVHFAGNVEKVCQWQWHISALWSPISLPLPSVGLAVSLRLPAPKLLGSLSRLKCRHTDKDRLFPAVHISSPYPTPNQTYNTTMTSQAHSNR